MASWRRQKLLYNADFCTNRLHDLLLVATSFLSSVTCFIGTLILTLLLLPPSSCLGQSHQLPVSLFLVLTSKPTLPLSVGTTINSSIMASLIATPPEVRVKIWTYAMPEEAETDVLKKCSNAIMTNDDHALPAKPVVQLLLICRKFRDEIPPVPRPTLVASINYVELEHALSWSRNQTK